MSGIKVETNTCSSPTFGKQYFVLFAPYVAWCIDNVPPLITVFGNPTRGQKLSLNCSGPVDLRPASFPLPRWCPSEVTMFWRSSRLRQEEDGWEGAERMLNAFLVNEIDKRGHIPLCALFYDVSKCENVVILCPIHLIGRLIINRIILSRITLQNTLLGMERRMIPRQLSHFWRCPFLGNLTIRHLVLMFSTFQMVYGLFAEICKYPQCPNGRATPHLYSTYPCGFCQCISMEMECCFFLSLSYLRRWISTSGHSHTAFSSTFECGFCQCKGIVRFSAICGFHSNWNAMAESGLIGRMKVWCDCALWSVSLT